MPDVFVIDLLEIGKNERVIAKITRRSLTDVESLRISIVCTEDESYDAVAFLPNGTFHMPSVYVSQNK
jgi:hypothetical protein